MQKPWIIGLAVVGLQAGLIAAASAMSPEDMAKLVNQPVQLVLEDGRTPRGVLSAKSNEEWFVLLTDVPDIMIESRFAAEIVQDIQPLAALRSSPQDLPELIVPPPPAPAIPAPAEALDSLSQPHANVFHSPTCVPDAIDPIDGTAIFPGIDPLGIPRSLNISTTVANWDADRENDGLLVRVSSIGNWGQAVPVEGYLDLQLLTETKFATGGRTVSRNEHFQIAERWSLPIHAIEFDPSGTIYKLPFRRIHPESNLNIAPDAMLLARMRVPSAGAFDAVDPSVRLRPTSRVREDYFLQQDPRRPSAHR